MYSSHPSICPTNQLTVQPASHPSIVPSIYILVHPCINTLAHIFRLSIHPSFLPSFQTAVEISAINSWGTFVFANLKSPKRWTKSSENLSLNWYEILTPSVCRGPGHVLSNSCTHLIKIVCFYVFVLRSVSLLSNGSLLITQVKPKYTGNYKCVGRGTGGSVVTQTASLQIAGTHTCTH